MFSRLVKLLTDQRVLAIFDQAVVSVCNFLTMIIVGRQIAVEDFGLFSLAMMSMLFFGNLHRAVFTQPMNILGAGDEKQQFIARMLALLRAHWFAIPLAVLSLGMLSHWFFPDMWLLAAVAVYVAAYFLQEMLRRYWYTLGNTAEALRNDLISYGGQVILLLLVSMTWQLDGAVAFAILAFTSILAFLFGLLKLDFPKERVTRASGAVLAEHWPLSQWLILTVLAVWGAGQVYPFLIAPLGPVVVASFSACRNLLNAMGIVVQSVNNFLPTRAAALLRKEGKTALRRHIRKTLLPITALALVFLGVTQAFAEIILNLVFGGIYDSAAPLLKILAWGSVSTLFAAVMGSYALAMGDSRSGFIANLGASIVTFTVGIWLINAEGVSGAATATALSLATAMLLQTGLVVYRYHHLPESGHA